jgi:tRNA modification GTPase
MVHSAEIAPMTTRNPKSQPHLPGGEETIAAVSTPSGEGAIAIVRCSGYQAISLADGIFRGKQRLSKAASHTLHHGRIVDPRGNRFIDDVLAAVMRSPGTYTGEDMVEISCHGGVLVTARILQLLLRQGARLAAPGEFTRRAYLNGRMDLLQAEAVAEVIRSKTDLGLEIAQRQLSGGCSRRLESVRDDLIEALALIEAGLDFSDQELPEDVAERARRPLDRSREALSELLRGAAFGRQLQEGFSVVLVGRPNVGKSSLFNALLGSDRVIVDAAPGTTRDSVSEQVTLKDLPVRLVDTAGLRAADGPVEREGVQRTRRQMEAADLLIVILDGSEPLRTEDVEILEQTEERESLVVINKVDLPRVMATGPEGELNVSRPVIETSATRGDGIDTAIERIARALSNGNGAGAEAPLVATLRHRQILEQALEAVQGALRGVRDEVGEELIAEDIRSALEALAGMTGRTSDQEVLDRIFNNFCVGK